MVKLKSETYNISIKDFSTIVLTLGLCTLYFLPPKWLFNSSHTFCIHKKIFHFDCPGCGMTRALYSFMHFNFRDAINFNFGVFSLVPFLLLEIILTFRFNKFVLQIKNLFYLLLCISLIIIYIQRLYYKIYY